MVRKLINRPTQEATNFHGLVSASPQMQELFGVVDRVARSGATVLLRGETGTGKELVAHSLHTSAHAPTRPFAPSTAPRSAASCSHQNCLAT